MCLCFLCLFLSFSSSLVMPHVVSIESIDILRMVRVTYMHSKEETTDELVLFVCVAERKSMTHFYSMFTRAFFLEFISIAECAISMVIFVCAFATTIQAKGKWLDRCRLLFLLLYSLWYFPLFLLSDSYILLILISFLLYSPKTIS